MTYLIETTTPITAINDLRFILNAELPTESLVEELLHFDAIMYQNLGKESPRYHRKAVKRTSKIIYDKLKEIDSDKFYSFNVD